MPNYEVIYSRLIVDTIAYFFAAAAWVSVAGYAHFLLRRRCTFIQVVSSATALVMLVLSKILFHPMWGLTNMSPETMAMISIAGSAVRILCVVSFFIGYVPVLKRAVCQKNLSRVGLGLQILGIILILGQWIGQIILTRLITAATFSKIIEYQWQFQTQNIALLVFIIGYSIMLFGFQKEKLNGV